MSGLDTERLVLAGGSLGIAQACLDAVLPHIDTRKQFQRSIGEFELIQGKVADMYTAVQSTRSYLYAIARSADGGSISRKDCASVILLAAENATQCALQAIQIFGGAGYMNECPAGRFLRDAKLYEIGAGTSEIRRYLIGRTLLSDIRSRKL
uniref:Isovaleryl-CoA dehydrogenase 2, mitochondrial n=1 Tax=Lygus hesperus TaxID=30085 RepID=A0A0A9XXC2_LYGHE